MSVTRIISQKDTDTSHHFDDLVIMPSSIGGWKPPGLWQFEIKGQFKFVRYDDGKKMTESRDCFWLAHETGGWDVDGYQP